MSAALRHVLMGVLTFLAACSGTSSLGAEDNPDDANDTALRDSTGLVPLTELRQEYMSEQGGLYPGAANSAPEAHLGKGLSMAEEIVPRDAEGRPAGDGKIVLLSIGMSNTTQEFQAFMELAAQDPEVSPRVVPVDGAQGGQSADRIANSEAPFWRVVDERLARAGASSSQVQAVWIKEATPRPVRPFPEEAKALQGYLVTILHILTDRFPNLKVAYLSSRIYAGYAESSLNPEPHAYETAFAVKWLIGDQVAGAVDLNCDPEAGPVRAPWLAWGPYLWADGLRARRDGLTYTRKDFGADGTHPSPGGRRKVAEQLLAFLKSDPTSRPWFMK